MSNEMKDKFEQLQQIIDAHKDQEGPLMPIMQQTQDLFGYLPMEAMDKIAESLGIPMTDVYGVATFYSQFGLKPLGKYKVGLCMGTACYVKGANQVHTRLLEELGVPSGTTTDDGLFTMVDTRCLGCCGLAPVMMVNDDVYGRLTPDDIPGILEKYRQQG
ncbi:MAG: NADH-quinone oxidoreductase subunit NuoE [Christensenellales bacterium]|jgi:NADH:ubiquinone oxidoreductase subunit E